MRRLRVSLVVLFLAAQSALAQIADAPFDARRLDPDEKRYLQLAVSFFGGYADTIDGKWGVESQRALEAHFADILQPGEITFGDLGPLLVLTLNELIESDWGAFHFEGPAHTLFLPMGLLKQESDDIYLTYANPDRSLLLRFLFDNPSKMSARHDWLVGADTRPEGGWRERSDTLIVTRARLEPGKYATLFSMPFDAGYKSWLLQYEGAQFERGWTIENSFRFGHHGLPLLAEGGIVYGLLSDPDDDGPRPEPEAADPGIGADLSGSGTGFFVNTTDIVTAAHVVTGCARLTLEDGTPLTVLATDRGLDLAILGADRRSAHFLPLSASPVAKLGEEVYALGYPYRDLFGQGLTVTGGNVSARPRSGDETGKLMISAPVQPGNSGGPVLNRDGEVVGVVVARADDMAVLEGTGTLPQNMNFAVSTGPLVEFLKARRILFPEGVADPAPVGDGIPPAVEAAVVTVLCY